MYLCGCGGWGRARAGKAISPHPALSLARTLFRGASRICIQGPPWQCMLGIHCGAPCILPDTLLDISGEAEKKSDSIGILLKTYSKTQDLGQLLRRPGSFGRGNLPFISQLRWKAFPPSCGKMKHINLLSCRFMPSNARDRLAG
ncbi:hypothetical protein BO94DRAFT_396360 [Aspergillus sclerotioniger CBS 115572]|uniref:Uncharacterized protein n=1 Tax=Aspergillus sclerotioniger CBS 115572 TaxID=1450535 RepID=A0A317X030_9EURO|nr:hypothetical protein BO94DRAFT_396360 [Aspergillus sclerotioniger CBS 115572]PWY91521.1 hypothetical protein BO94DRAFT_396360 [Aspergillus sclerotioniger CBS 115572]